MRKSLTQNEPPIFLRRWRALGYDRLRFGLFHGIDRPHFKQFHGCHVSSKQSNHAGYVASKVVVAKFTQVGGLFDCDFRFLGGYLGICIVGYRAYNDDVGNRESIRYRRRMMPCLRKAG